ncbi:MAG: hypothetical protein ACQEQR_03085 [Pseudomonadota bacterium]
MDTFIKAFDFQNNSARLSITFLVVIFIILSWMGVLDALSQDYIDEAIVQSTVAFGVARGLNALISMLQSTTISIQMLGGVAVSVGEVLDPMNDLVEQYSSLMKMSIGSLVIQKLLIEIVSDVFFKVVITLSGITLILSFFYQQTKYINVLAKTFVFLFFIRFMLVLVVLLNGVVDRAFIQDKIEQDVASLDQLSQEVESNADNKPLTETEKTELLLLKDRYQKEIKVAGEANQVIGSSISQAQQKLIELETKLNQLQDEQDLSERLNPFSSDVEVALRSQISNIKSRLSGLDSEFNHNINVIQQAQEEILSLENSLQGKPNGFAESVSQKFNVLGDKFSNMTSKADVTAIKERLEDSVASIITVMSIFLFKTLILPIIFLLLLIKGTNAIWGIDVKELVDKESAEFLNK